MTKKKNGNVIKMTEKRIILKKRMSCQYHCVQIMSLFVGALMLSGCGANLPELESQQEDLIAEYAVSLLLETDSNYKGRLVDTSEIETERELLQLAEQEKVLVTEEAQSKDPAIDGVVEEVVSETEAFVEVPKIEMLDIAGILGLENLNIKYTTTEIFQEYPNTGKDEAPVFVLTAAAGKELLLINFEVENTSLETIALDMIKIPARYYIGINGERERFTLTTILLNDMSTYRGEIEAGNSEKLVLVIEIPEGTVIDTVELNIKIDGIDNISSL